jgi:hypothetical protein
MIKGKKTFFRDGMVIKTFLNDQRYSNKDNEDQE